MFVVFIVALLIGTVFSGDKKDSSSSSINQKSSLTPLPTIRIKDNLTKQIKKAGDGKTFPVTKQTISVLYSLHIAGVFVEEVKDRKHPFVTEIGVDAVIVGWDIGILTMSLGEICILSVPPEMGYGERGSGKEVPGNSTLIFEIELLKAV
jgi:FKBP-type peptidyl-prolyl cis-trans isomerase